MRSITDIWKRLTRKGIFQKSKTLSDGSRRQDEAVFKVLAENSGDVILHIGQDHRARYVSPSCLRVLGWTPEEMVGRGPDKFIFPEDLPIIQKAAQRKTDGTQKSDTETFRVVRKDGSLVWVEGNAQPISDPITGEVGHLVLILRDITDHKKLEERLSAMALTDGLTGLANRRAFDQALEHEWQRTLHDASQMSLLLLDLDRFKSFNDHYGHQVGDDCLRTVSAVMKETIRLGDLAARYGGEELAIILPNTDSVRAAQIAEDVRSAIEALQVPHLQNSDGHGRVTASIGAATALCRAGGTMRMPESLLAAADSALYKAKHGGRNRVGIAMLLASSNGP